MSKKTSIPQKRIHFDRGIQSYRSCNKGYSEGMRNTTFKEVKDAAGDARIVRESEFAKPYGEQYEEPHEDFWAMEYGAPDWPPWGWDYPGMEDPASRWRVTFFCDIDPCWEDDATRVFNAKCGWELIGVEFDPPEEDFSVSFSGTTVSITAVAGASGNPQLTLTMRATFKIGEDQYKTVVGTHSGISVSECKDTSVLCNDSGMSWDMDLSGDTVVRNGNVSVYIKDSTGLGGPYSWAVSGSGSGMTLQDAVTTGLSNVLYADGAACGPAIITVTGCDGSQVADTVRCTTGNWAHCGLKDYRASLCGSGTYYPGYVGSCEVGMYRYYRNAGAGAFFSGATGGCSCYAQITCNPGPWAWLSIARLAGDPRAACDFGGDLCYDTSSWIWFDYWTC